MAHRTTLLRPGWKFHYPDILSKIGEKTLGNLGYGGGVLTKAALALIPFVGNSLNILLGDYPSKSGEKVGKIIGNITGRIGDEILQSPLTVVDTLFPSFRGTKRTDLYPEESNNQPISQNVYDQIDQFSPEFNNRNNIKRYLQPTKENY